MLTSVEGCPPSGGRLGSLFCSGNVKPVLCERWYPEVGRAHCGRRAVGARTAGCRLMQPRRNQSHRVVECTIRLAVTSNKVAASVIAGSQAAAAGAHTGTT